MAKIEFTHKNSPQMTFGQLTGGDVFKFFAAEDAPVFIRTVTRPTATEDGWINAASLSSGDLKYVENTEEVILVKMTATIEEIDYGTD